MSLRLQNSGGLGSAADFPVPGCSDTAVLTPQSCSRVRWQVNVKYPVALACHTSQKWFAKGSTWRAEEGGIPLGFLWSVFQVPCSLRRQIYQCVTWTSAWVYVFTTWPEEDSAGILLAICPLMLPLTPVFLASCGAVTQGSSFIAWGNFACILFSGVLLSHTYPAWSQVQGDRIICQPTWVAVAGVMWGKKKYLKYQQKWGVPDVPNGLCMNLWRHECMKLAC